MKNYDAPTDDALALGSWSVWSLAQTADDNDPIGAAVTLRVRYYFILTLCLNLWCASKCIFVRHLCTYLEAHYVR